MKRYLYIVYDWPSREIKAVSYNRDKAYAKIGEDIIQGENTDDYHVIEVDLEAGNLLREIKEQKQILKFKEGQLVVYKGSNGYEIGKIKKIKDDHSAWVWYHDGDTAALTDFSLINPLTNDYYLEDILNKEI